MIHEFALDPDTVNDWPVFKYVVDQCGVQYGRLISCFPRNWQKETINACQIHGARRTAVVEKLRSIKHKLVNSHREYDRMRGWLDNAELQHIIKPFHAIISVNNPRNHEKILIAGDVDEKTTLWIIPKEKIVPRKAYDLAICVKMLLNISREILLIDPHFNPQLPRYVETFSRLIHFAFENNNPQRLELHVEYNKRSPTLEWWQESCEAQLSPFLPNDTLIKILRWQEKNSGDKPHARYILSERGGIRFDYGLDEWEGEGQTTDVSLLDHALYEKRWNDYQKGTAAFDLVDEILIKGLKIS